MSELLSASRRKHLRYYGQGLWRGGIWRAMKIALSPRTGSIRSRSRSISTCFSRENIDFPLAEPRFLPRELVRMEPWEIEYLFAAAAISEVGILEVGRCAGGSTLVLSAASREIPIWSIDIAPQADARLADFFSQFGVGHNVSLLVGNSATDEFEVGAFDLLWIDGDHSFRGCLDDITRWWPKLRAGGSMLLHDCYSGCEVQVAVGKFLLHANDAEVVTGSVNSSRHHRSPSGSLCHIRKRVSAG